MTSQYKNNKSVAKNPTVSIDVDDPRVSWENLKQTQSRIGSEVEIIGGEGRQVLFGGSFNPVRNDSNIVTPEVPKVPGVPVPGTPPLPVENLVGSWGPNGGITLTFDFDTTNDLNVYIDRFLIKVYDSETLEWTDLKAGFGYPGSTFLNYVSASQTLFLSAKDIDQSLDISTIISNITKVAVATADILNIGEYVEANMPAFVSDLPQPEFTLTAGVDYYLVTLDPTNIALALTKGFYGVIVEEKVTTEMIKANVGTTGWVQAAPISSGTSVVVYTPDGLHRWVRLRYVKSYGEPSIYSDIKDITPIPFMPDNTDPPAQFTAASIQWVGDDIRVNFTLPAENVPTTVKVKLVPYINGVESPTLYSDHYHVIIPTVDFFMIRSAELKANYNTYYSTFKGYITSISDQGVPTVGATIVSGPITRAGLLSNIYPTLGIPNSSSPQGIFRVTPSVSGYIVDFDLPNGASRLEVYEKSTPWTVIPTNDNLVVYSGLSPATIPTPMDDFAKRYVIVRYYDLYGGHSYYSMEKPGGLQTAGVEVTPIDIGLQSLITYPIKISTNGSIFSGIGGKDDNPRVFFNPGGLFAYDANGIPTTQLINNAAANAPTLVTRNARIADWSIAEQVTGISPNQVTRNYIQNDLYASDINKTYTGLSSNGTYSFWAGAGTSLNTDASAAFSVKPNGEVVATKIIINGGGTDGTLIDTPNFDVTRDGLMTAMKAIIKGTIEVDGQSYFDANVNVRNGYLIAGANGPAVGPNVQISSEGLKAIDVNEVATTKIYSSPQSVNIIDALDTTKTPVAVPGITMWSSKALFGSNESSGWVISDGVIKANYIRISSSDQSIIIASQTTNSAKGIVLRANSDTGYAISAGNIADPSTAPFSVTTQGDLYAQNAIIQGTVRANNGGFGTVVSNAVTAGWLIGAAGLTAQGAGRINLSSGGAITVGDYSITSSGTNFVITQVSNGLNLMKTESLSGVTEDPLRLFLGDSTRQVEVAKSAQVSGAGTNLQFGSDTTTNNAYRSGGLRNMYTVATGAAGSAIYPSAVKGDILLVYNPNLGL